MGALIMEKPNLRPLPAYQEYATDILSNRAFRLMGLAEKGLLWHMRMEYWANNSLPANVDELAKTLGLSSAEVLDAFSPSVQSFFKNRGEGFYSPELEGYRENCLAKREKLSVSGQKGGQSTQSKHKQVKASLEASLKPLSGDEKNGYEERGEELTNKAVMDKHRDFINALGEDNSIRTSSYEKLSRGH